MILRQMSEYIKYFDSGGKNMSFKNEDDNILVKYNKIWNRIKKKMIKQNLVASLFMKKNT